MASRAPLTYWNLVSLFSAMPVKAAPVSKAPVSKKPASPKRATGEKRSPAELAKLTEKLGEYIKAHPGFRIEAIGKALGTPTRELNLPVKKLLAAKKIRTEGHKRARSTSRRERLGHVRRYPSRMTSLLDHPELSRTIFFPRRSFVPPPPGARDVMLEVDSGVHVHARIHDHPGAVAVVVLFHGNGEVVSDYDNGAAGFGDADGALAVIDFRGYGRSEGAPNLRNLVGDARPALEALLPHLPGTGGSLPIVVMGRSLGSACAAEIARTVPELIAGIVFESGFSDVAGLARRRGLTVASVAEEDLEVLCPLRKLARSRTPLLVLHGEDDRLIAPEEGRAAYEASQAEDKSFVLVPRRGHNNVSRHPLYWEELAAFLRRVASEVHRQA